MLRDARLPTRRRGAYRMHMVAAAKVWTVEEVLALPWDGRRIELIDGALIVNGVEVPDGILEQLEPEMTPAPAWSHQHVLRALIELLLEYTKRSGVGIVMFAPADVPLAGEQVVQPDLFVVPRTGEHLPDDFRDAGRMLLAVEIVSPSTARMDRTRKRALYQSAGVPDYWVVDVESRRIERWRLDSDIGHIFTVEMEWAPPGASELLRVDIPALFKGLRD
ncbi:MAG TPA: Uma2 family endonuclease [Gemmatimonadaceae bacterium]|nr:Uma2 family endonuclease [Gemmatimonadaceae bacterium]